MRNVTIVVAMVGIACLAMPAGADWNEGDDHKMHYPQMPDPNGWDVDITNYWVADDWTCGGTGPVDDIHFWYSWQGDLVGTVNTVGVKIWNDVPADGENPYSHPGQILWERDFAANSFEIAGPWEGDQGWLDPATGTYNCSDHDLYFQINLTDIAEPFPQEKDTIYWLELHIIPATEDPQPIAGWKTSGSDHWLDDAVYEAGPDEWVELHDPMMGNSLDMAFVITPEPATMTLLAVGAVALLRRRSR